ncbi:MAG: three-Cys-motif partner protein TcmP [Gemmataceae bacterium]|nr:three-Cys-motif partner protein TcmP [Gemmataceae bacterium]
MSEFTADGNPEYWTEYSNLQHVKHALIRNYLNGWFPKLALGPWGSSRLLYIDTHAGRGKHLKGQLGSPLVALRTLLDHTSRDKILAKTEVRFIFVERNEANLSALKSELAAIQVPKKVFIDAKAGDAFEIIDNTITSYDREGAWLAPSFIFVDPYGFKLPSKLLRKLLSYPKIELFVNVIWRELDMAVCQARSGNQELEGLVGTLNSIFDGDAWRSISADDPDERAVQCVELFRKLSGARWGTYIRMLDKNRVRYLLLHLTKHPDGRDLMKGCIWQACPDGGYYASKSDNPDQQLLIEPEPDLALLGNWVIERLRHGPKNWQFLIDELREELWLSKQLNEVVRSMRKNGQIIGENYTGRFAATNNPRLRLREKSGE